MQSMLVSNSSSKMIISRYLLVYNIVMTAGWTVVLLHLIQAWLQQGDMYNEVILPLQIFQTGAVLEIIHSLTRIIRAPVATTTLQVCSRLFVLWTIIYPVYQIETNLSVITMIAAWSLTEIPRYFYFSVAAASSHVPYWLTYLRYSTFIPLYPIGASSEWFTIYSALNQIKQNNLFSIYLPNRFNFAFDFYTFCLIILLLYIPGLPHMYYHMLRQRRKYVVAPAKKLEKTK